MPSWLLLAPSETCLPVSHLKTKHSVGHRVGAESMGGREEGPPQQTARVSFIQVFTVCLGVPVPEGQVGPGEAQ